MSKIIPDVNNLSLGLNHTARGDSRAVFPSVLDSNFITNTLQVKFGDRLSYIKVIRTCNYFEVIFSEMPYFIGGFYGKCEK